MWCGGLEVLLIWEAWGKGKPSSWKMTSWDTKTHLLKKSYKFYPLVVGGYLMKVQWEVLRENFVH